MGGGASFASINSSKKTLDTKSNNALRLNWNENPYGPSASAKEAMMKAMHHCNHYPDDVVNQLKEKLATKHKLQSNQVMLTAGSTEVLSLLGQHVGLNQGEILIPWPSFPTMIRFGERCGATVRKVDLNKDTIDLENVMKAISRKTQLIFICNPNNPTSTELDKKDLISFCRTVPSNVLICVDEAYIEYSKHGMEGSMVSLVDELPNLVICRTFSKAYGLAGLRIGYAMSNTTNIDALRNRHTGWELSAGIVPLQAAMATMDDQAFLDHCVEENRLGRSIVYDAFQTWGIETSNSATNFIYARSEKLDHQIVDKLRKENILITKWPDMTDHIRISIGTLQDMQRFVDAAQKYVIS